MLEFKNKSVHTIFGDIYYTYDMVAEVLMDGIWVQADIKNVRRVNGSTATVFIIKNKIYTFDKINQFRMLCLKKEEDVTIGTRDW